MGMEQGQGIEKVERGIDELKLYCSDALGNRNKRKHRNQGEILIYLLKVNSFPPDV